MPRVGGQLVICRAHKSSFALHPTPFPRSSARVIFRQPTPRATGRILLPAQVLGVNRPNGEQPAQESGGEERGEDDADRRRAPADAPLPGAVAERRVRDIRHEETVDCPDASFSRCNAKWVARVRARRRWYGIWDGVMGRQGNRERGDVSSKRGPSSEQDPLQSLVQYACAYLLVKPMQTS